MKGALRLTPWFRLLYLRNGGQTLIVEETPVKGIFRHLLVSVVLKQPAAGLWIVIPVQGSPELQIIVSGPLDTILVTAHVEGNGKPPHVSFPRYTNK